MLHMNPSPRLSRIRIRGARVYRCNRLPINPANRCPVFDNKSLTEYIAYCAFLTQDTPTFRERPALSRINTKGRRNR